MSSIKYQLYVDGVMRLAKSIILKDESVAAAVNTDVNLRGLATGFTVDLQRPETWKYYLNLAGLYHPMDTPMTIVSLDTMETISFDVDTLKTHRATVREYRQNSRYYNDLIEKYPNQETLISGILNPIPLDRVLSAPNYTILYFDASEVEPQETDLISRLQDWIYAYVRRWYIRDYNVTDNLFDVAFLGVLFAQFPGVIMALRQDNVRTYRAHSFHVWSYLESTGRLGRFRGYLTEQQQMWLYRNIRWVFLNSGKQETFEALVENLLTKRSIPIGHYQHRVNVATISTDLYGKAEFERLPLNLTEIVTKAKPIRTINYVLEKEAPLARDNALYLEEHQALANNAFSKAATQEGPSRVMESEMLDRSELLPITLKEFQIQHWFYLAASGKYTASITVNNPYTTEQLRMSVKDAALLWFYLGVKINGVQLLQIPPIVARVVRRMPLPVFNVLRGRVGPLVKDSEIRTILGDHEPIRSLISTEAFYDITETMHKTYLKQRVYHHNEQHYFKRAELEMTIMGCYQDYICSFTNHTTFDAYFTALGWDINAIPLSDLKLMFDQISKVALGADLKDVKSARDIQTAMLQMMRQLGAYTTQIIQNINEQPAIIVDQPTARLGTLSAIQQDTVLTDNKGTDVDQVTAVGKDHAQLELFDTTLVTLKYMREKVTGHYEITAQASVKTGIREIVKVNQSAIWVEPRFQGRDIVDSWDDIPDSNYVEPSYDVVFMLNPPRLQLGGMFEMIDVQSQLETLSFVGGMQLSGGFTMDIVQEQQETFNFTGNLELSGSFDMSYSEEVVKAYGEISLLRAPQITSIELVDKYTTDVVASQPYPFVIGTDSATLSAPSVNVTIETSLSEVVDTVNLERTVAVTAFTATRTVVRQSPSDMSSIALTHEITDFTLTRTAIRSTPSDNTALSLTHEVTDFTLTKVANRQTFEQDSATASSAFPVSVTIVTV